MGGRIALLIGSGSYGVGALQQLHAPAGDVRELAVVLGDAYAGGFDTVIELIDASTQQVGREIARTLDRCKRDDLVLLYFSGHALLDDEGQLHLAMRDTEPDLLSPTSISAAFVAGEFDRSRSRRQLVILDCCAGTGFAHGTAEAAALIAPDAPRVASAFYAESQPRAVFAACRRATDSARPHSRFTHALIQGLRGAADGDGDGRISIDDLARYLEPHASAWLGEAVGSLLIANTSPRASSPPRAAARPPHPGGLISDRYRIESVLAERGIGVLCSAIDERDGRPVSVKYLRSPESSDATTLQRFLREAGVAGAI
ncbi:MAG TPA: caspase family protein, partial [Polyangiales bacterium]|nr:caspase family protein [Polyangiales bacterium]